MQGKMNSRKEIKILAFGCAMKNSLENDFQCLVTHSENAIFLQIFHTFSAIFLATKQILYQKIHNHPQKIHHYPHKTHNHTTQKPPKRHHPHHHNNNKKKKSEIKERADRRRD